MNELQEKRPEEYPGIRPAFVAGWQLAKVPLCLLIACSTAFGAVLAPSASGRSVILSAFSVLVLAMGCATLNSLQEKILDRSMRRTAARPLARNKVSSRFACIQSVILLGAGMALLTVNGGTPAVTVMGGLAILLYNGIYTRLKKLTVMALLPGGICGGLPPLIGWVGAGGQLLSYMPLLLFVLLFMWQMPHFCLILLRYRNDYLAVNQPNFMRLLQEKGVKRLSIVWISALALIMMLFAVSPATVWQWQSFMLVANALLLSALTIFSLLQRLRSAYQGAFLFLNTMLFNHMLILSVGFFHK